jgi:hypothetical protein
VLVAEAAGGDEPPVAADDDVVVVSGDDRLQEAELAERAGECIELGVADPAGVFGSICRSSIGTGAICRSVAAAAGGTCPPGSVGGH